MSKLTQEEMNKMSAETRAVNEEILIEEYDQNVQTNAEIIADIVRKDADMFIAGNDITPERLVKDMPFIFGINKSGAMVTKNAPERITGKSKLSRFDECMNSAITITREYTKNPFRRLCIGCQTWKLETTAEVTNYLIENNKIFGLVLSGWIVTLR